MKSLKRISTSIMAAALLFFILPFTGMAQNLQVVNKQVIVEGTSTLHDWTTEAQEIKASGNIVMEGSMLKDVKNFMVTIPVEKLESTKGNKMNRNTHKALKSDEHPNITFKLSEMASIQSAGNNVYNIKAKGQLTIAGQSKNVTLDARAEVESGGAVCFSGTYKLNMKDYGVEPPSFMLGAMSTGEEVTISYSVTVK